MMSSRAIPSSTPREITEPPTLTTSRRTTDFGLVVGVDHYPSFRSLRGAVNDATDFHSWLLDSHGGGLEPEHARLVVSQPNPVSPLQDEVDEQLLAIVNTADAVGGGRRLYFHFTGHGAGSPEPKGQDVALLLAKWSRNLARIALSTDEYSDALGGMGLFEEIVISLDCCRATAVCAIGMPPTLTVQPSTKPCPTRTFIAYATEHGRSSFETVDQGLWRGVFTRALLAILRGSPGISAAALKQALEYKVAGYGQEAHVINGLRDDSRFGGSGARRKLVVRFEHAHGVVRLKDGHYTIIAEHVVSEARWELLLIAGMYKLEDSRGRWLTFEHGDAEVTNVVL